MKRIEATFIIIFVALFLLPVLSKAQKIEQYKYYEIEVYNFNTITGIYSKESNQKSSGFITITGELLSISSNEKMPEQKLKVISQHRDNASNIHIYICHSETNRCTMVLMPDKSAISLLDKGKKYVYKLRN